MKTKVHLALNAWLQKADGNYLEGRVLWLKLLLNGASNLLWLSIEQALKILILQDRIAIIDSTCKDLGAVHKALDEEAKSISKRHSRIEIVQQVENTYNGLDLTPYYNVMDKLEEYFFRRYVVDKNSSL